mmetsp:Transcript_35538/g.65830  ORF Transcript_35538/g.65830 Transcript_35538/m.65830 type:complete len:93 (-) Transcript_35538:424-702(-)
MENAHGHDCGFEATQFESKFFGKSPFENTTAIVNSTVDSKKPQELEIDKEFDIGSFLKDDEPSSHDDIFSGLPTGFLNSNLDADLFDFPIDI